MNWLHRVSNLKFCLNRHVVEQSCNKGQIIVSCGNLEGFCQSVL